MNCLKNKVKQFIREEEGSIFIWFLIFVMILVYVMTFEIDTKNMESLSKQLENNLQIAALAAAEATPDSLAANNPQIDPVVADATFKSILAENLRLDPVSFLPLANSRLKNTPTYSLFTYNGPFPFPYTEPITGQAYTLTEPSVVVGVSEQYNHMGRNHTNTIKRSDVAKIHKK